MRYVLPSLLFLAGKEELSLLALIIIVVVFLSDIVKAAFERPSWNAFEEYYFGAEDDDDL